MGVIKYCLITVTSKEEVSWYNLIPTNDIEPDMLDALHEHNGRCFYEFLSYTYTYGDTETDLSDKWDITWEKLEPYRMNTIPTGITVESKFNFHINDEVVVEM